LVPTGVETVRFAGANRYDTAIRVSKSSYPSGADTVYVAVGLQYADALSAAPAAALNGGPLLLTRRNVLEPEVKAEIQRLSPDLIVVVGGTGAISDDVYRQLAALAPSIRRD